MAGNWGPPARNRTAGNAEGKVGEDRGHDGEEQETNMNDFSPHFHNQSGFSGQAEIFPFGQTMDHSHFLRPHWADNVLHIPYPSGYRPSKVTRPSQKFKESSENTVTPVTCE